MENLSQNLKNYKAGLQRRKLTTKAKTYFANIVEKYEEFIKWDNLTLKDDRALFYMYASRFYKRNGEYKLTKLLEWVKDKNCLHPKQIIKVLAK